MNKSEIKYNASFDRTGIVRSEEGGGHALIKVFQNSKNFVFNAGACREIFYSVSTLYQEYQRAN